MAHQSWRLETREHLVLLAVWRNAHEAREHTLHQFGQHVLGALAQKLCATSHMRKLNAIPVTGMLETHIVYAAKERRNMYSYNCKVFLS